MGAGVKTEAVKSETVDDLFSSPKRPTPVPDARGFSNMQPRSTLLDDKTTIDKNSKEDLSVGKKGSEKTTLAASGKDPFSLDDGDDIFAKGSFKTAATDQSKTGTKHDKTATAADDDDDLFGGKQLLSSSKKTATSKTKVPEAKVLSSTKPPASTPSPMNDVDDNLFGAEVLIKPTAPVAASEEVSAKKHLLSSDDDDIFNVPKNASASSAAKTKAAAMIVKAAQDADDDDDDDIFANSSLAPKGYYCYSFFPIEEVKVDCKITVFVRVSSWCVCVTDEIH